MTGATVGVSACERLARELLAAERGATAIEPLTTELPRLSLADAYEVQRRGRDLRLADGAALTGRKVGLTSVAMQQMLGVDQPDFGYLTDAMLVPPGASVHVGGLIAPRVEAEIAFRLRRPLHGATVTREEVLAATEAVAPAIEVIDSRIADWRITIADTIADNASCGRYAVGTFSPVGDLDLAALPGELTVHGARGIDRVEGRGGAVLGHPADALVWLARALNDFGEGIEAGAVVLPGAIARALPIESGDTVQAGFAGLGELQLRVEEGSGARWIP